MKTKLTITIDQELLPAIRRYARERGVSLSALVEEALRGTVECDRPGFVERWRGAFTLADADDERSRALREKYG